MQAHLSAIIVPAADPDKHYLVLKRGTEVQLVVAFASRHLPEATAAAGVINAHPGLVAQLEETTNQLSLYAVPPEQGTITVVTESRRLLSSLK